MSILSKRTKKASTRSKRASKKRPQLELENLERRQLLVAGAAAIPAPVAAATGYDGVVSVNGGGCSGSLLYTGRHVLTAGHCVTAGQSANVTFNMAAGAITLNVPATSVTIHPDYAAKFHDVAILALPELAPSGISGVTGAERYDLYRQSNEVGREFTIVGYGNTGTGTTGCSINSAVKRLGTNRYDATRSSNTRLAFDFDNNTSSRNRMGSQVPVANEAMVCPGDSGGPDFIGNRIAGVHSYHENWLPNTPRGSFGTIGVSARVSTFANWIDSTILGQYDLVLDMDNQVVGNNGGSDSIAVRRGGPQMENLEVLVNGVVYHSDSMFAVRSLTIRGSGDNDKISLQHNYNLNVYLDGGGGTDTLVGQNRYNKWEITSLNRGRLNSQVYFSSVESLWGNANQDVFDFSDGARVSGQVKGEGGRDTLDYSDYRSNVTVNLQNYSATGTANVWGIEDVRGGFGNDILTGNSVSNYLYGGRGSDQLRGLGGEDVLDGGDDYATDKLWGGSGRDYLIQHWWYGYGSGYEDSIQDQQSDDVLLVF